MTGESTRPMATDWTADKESDLETAAGLVATGSSLALGGMSLYRKPVAFVAELIRQRKRDLTLYGFTCAYESDLLVGAGAVAEVHSCYFGLDIFGLAPMYRRAVERGELRVVDETEKTMMSGLRATRAGVDFMPIRTMHGTDFRRLRPDLLEIESPYSDTAYLAAPAIELEFAVIHALIADRRGNAVLGGQYALDEDFAAVASTTIVTCERIVESAEIESHGADLLGGHVDLVVEVPGGARPTSCHPAYRLDVDTLVDYVEACRADDFEGHLERHVFAD